MLNVHKVLAIENALARIFSAGIGVAILAQAYRFYLGGAKAHLDRVLVYWMALDSFGIWFAWNVLVHLGIRHGPLVTFGTGFFLMLMALLSKPIQIPYNRLLYVAILLSLVVVYFVMGRWGGIMAWGVTRVLGVGAGLFILLYIIVERN